MSRHNHPVSESRWSEVEAAIAAAPYPVDVLPPDPPSSQLCLDRLGITTRSWLGAVVAHTGGLLIDHGWLRVLGGGGGPLPDVASQAEPALKLLVVAHDVLGGQFAWVESQPGAGATVHYFGPDSLSWEDLGRSYSDWLAAMLAGALTDFYDSLRWPGWEADVAAVSPDHGLHTLPPPWMAVEDPSTISRKSVPMPELIALHHEFARQLGDRPG